RAEEASLVGRLWLFGFCLGLATVLFRTAAESLFLGRFGPAALPAAYLAAVALAGLLVASYGRLQATAGLPAGLAVLLGAFLAGILLVRLTLLLPEPGPGLAAGRALAGAAYLIGDLGFWTVATSLLDLRQGKRLFAFLGTGPVLAEVLGGTAAPL